MAPRWRRSQAPSGVGHRRHAASYGRERGRYPSRSSPRRRCRAGDGSAPGPTWPAVGGRSRAGYAPRFRTIRRSPGFTTVALVTLTLGIGANTAIFSFVNVLVWRDLPVRDPGSLVQFTWQYPGDPPLNLFSIRNYEHYRDHNSVFSDLIGEVPFRLGSDTAGLGAEPLNTAWVTGNFFGPGCAPRAGTAAGPPRRGAWRDSRSRRELGVLEQIQSRSADSGYADFGLQCLRAGRLRRKPGVRRPADRLPPRRLASRRRSSSQPAGRIHADGVVEAGVSIARGSKSLRARIRSGSR